METIGLIGIGKIGLPIAENLIKSGYRVLGYRRSAMTDFEQIGGVSAGSPAEIGAQTDIVLTCLPSAEALDAVVQGKNGLVNTARPGQIVVELGSHLVPDKERQIAPLAAKGAIFLDGEVGGTPGMVRARKAVIYLAGDAQAAKKAEAVARAISDIVHYFGAFGAASKVKLINNLLVGGPHRRRRRSHGAGPEGRRRRRSDDQSGGRRQRRLDPIRHPRALDGRAPVPAGARRSHRPVALFRADWGFRRSRRRGDADARPRDRAV